MGGSFGGGPLLFPVAVLALILVVTWLCFARREPLPVKPSDGALDLLRRRYAAGEIDEKEYLLIRENLS